MGMFGGAHKRCEDCGTQIALVLTVCQACDIKRAQKKAAADLRASLQARAEIETEIRHLEHVLAFEAWLDEHDRR